MQTDVQASNGPAARESRRKEGQRPLNSPRAIKGHQTQWRRRPMTIQKSL